MAVAAFFGVFDQMLPVFQGDFAETGLYEGFTIQLTFAALSSDVVLLILPILAAIPFTSAFLDDYKSRFIREYLPRIGKKRYVNAKVLTTAFAGGITLFVGVILVLAVFAILFLPMEAPADMQEQTGYAAAAADSMTQELDITAQLNFTELMTRSFVFFLCGCLWSLVGGLLAAITQSKYMAYASPFVFYYVLVILSERYFKEAYVINPQEWVNPMGDWVGGTWGVALFVGELIVIAGLVYAYVIGRRLRDV